MGCRRNVRGMPEGKKRRKQNQPRTARTATPRDPGATSAFALPVIVSLICIGVAVVVLNYLPEAPLLPGDTSNTYLLLGILLIILGLVAAAARAFASLLRKR